MKIEVKSGRLDGIFEPESKLVGEYFVAANTFGNRVRVIGTEKFAEQDIKNKRKSIKDILVAFSARGTKIDAAAFPELIPILCAVASFANSDTEIFGFDKTSENLSLIRGCVSAFNDIGGELNFDGERILIKGKYDLSGGGKVNANSDFKTAMAIVLAATCTIYPVVIENFPDSDAAKKFLSDFSSLGGKINVLE